MNLLGAASITGNQTIEQTVPLAGLKVKPKARQVELFQSCAARAVN